MKQGVDAGVNAAVHGKSRKNIECEGIRWHGCAFGGGGGGGGGGSGVGTIGGAAGASDSRGRGRGFGCIGTKVSKAKEQIGGKLP